MPPSAAQLGTLLASQWHGLFYPSLLSGGDGSDKVSAALWLLDAAGFTKAGDLAAATVAASEEEADVSKNINVSNNSSRALVGEASALLSGFTVISSCGRPLSWPQLFLIHGVSAAAAANCGSSSGEGKGSKPVDLAAALARMSSGGGASSSSSCLFAALSEALLQLSADGAISNGSSADHASTAPSPLLFALVDPATSKLAAGRESHAARRAFLEARLYAALCLHCYFPTVKQLAKLLVVFINQEEEIVSQAVSSTAAGGGGGGNPQSGPPATHRRQRAEVRARGVIAGLLECALWTAKAAPAALRSALDGIKDGSASSESNSGSGHGGIAAVVSAFGPRPEQSRAVTAAASLTLTLLVAQATQLKEARNKNDTNSGSSKSESLIDGAFLAAETIHTIQELLFTCVLGAGTVNMPNRPARPLQQQQQAGYFTVTDRPLTLAEFDALVVTVFPLLLQQLGYEWPWSELLRHCRSLDRLQVAPSFPYVAQSSGLVMETVLLGLSHRSYPQRLQNLLPGSFDRLREKLDMLPKTNKSNNGNGNEGDKDGDENENGEGGSKTAPLFALPPYYREAAEPLLSYYSCTGIGGIRTDEAERVLSQAVSTLPMVIQLRALAPPPQPPQDDINGDAKKGTTANHHHHHRHAITAARAAALETRFMAEVLLASVIAHTQLQTHSQVQGMMRELAPLFARLSLTLSRHASALAAPLLIRRSASDEASHSTDNSSSSSSGALVFSDEAEKLMNDVGYQFYPLEWLPLLAQSYHEQQQQQRRSSSGNDDSLFQPSAVFTSATQFPYSVFAAVAHQLDASFQSPLGSASGGNCPAGFRSSAIRGVTAREQYLAGDGNSSGSGSSEMWPLQRAERLLGALMLPCWLDSRLASGELEGTMAVTATRVVVGHSSSSSSGGGGGGSGDDGLLARLSHLLKPRVLEAFWGDDDERNASNSSVHAGHKRTREGDSSARPVALEERDEEAVRALTNALLRSGASSYELTIEAKDFMLAVAQCFLPCTTNLFPSTVSTASGKRGAAAATATTAAKSKVKVTVELLRGALAWCQATVGGPAVQADVRMQLQQQQQQGNDNSSGMNPVDAIFGAVYNSCTLDACAIARRVLLSSVPARLLEKLQLRQRMAADLTARRDKCIRLIRGGVGAGEGADSAKNSPSAGTAEVDPLLVHQWSQFVGLLQAFALLPASDEASGGGVGGVGVGVPTELSAAQWIWYSPYSTN